jgi:hypothetical protein
MNTYPHVIIKNLLPVILISLLITACDLNDTAPPQQGQAVINAEFIDAETEEPVTDIVFIFAVETANTDGIIPIDEVTPDEDGRIETGIIGEPEDTITRIIFEYEDEEQEVQSLDESVNLEIRTEEPFDEVNLVFEL